MQFRQPARFKLLARVAAVILVCAILLTVTPRHLKSRQAQPAADQREQSQATVDQNTAVATTDINLRAGPNSRAAKVGLVERDSKVRLVSPCADRRWCEVEVLRHGRAKEDPSSSDRGWVNRTYLKVD
jgi:hypothetical protein